jgi:hypothetical protein
MADQTADSTLVHCSHRCPGSLCIKHVVAESPSKNTARVFCTRKGVTLADCECDPKCVFLKKYTKDVWV